MGKYGEIIEDFYTERSRILGRCRMIQISI